MASEESKRKYSRTFNGSASADDQESLDSIPDDLPGKIVINGRNLVINRCFHNAKVYLFNCQNVTIEGDSVIEEINLQFEEHSVKKIAGNAIVKKIVTWGQDCESLERNGNRRRKIDRIEGNALVSEIDGFIYVDVITGSSKVNVTGDYVTVGWIQSDSANVALTNKTKIMSGCSDWSKVKRVISPNEQAEIKYRLAVQKEQEERQRYYNSAQYKKEIEEREEYWRKVRENEDIDERNKRMREAYEN